MSSGTSYFYILEYVKHSKYMQIGTHIAIYTQTEIQVFYRFDDEMRLEVKSIIWLMSNFGCFGIGFFSII